MLRYLSAALPSPENRWEHGYLYKHFKPLLNYLAIIILTSPSEKSNPAYLVYRLTGHLAGAFVISQRQRDVAEAPYFRARNVCRHELCRETCMCRSDKVGGIGEATEFFLHGLSKDCKESV